MLSYNTSIHEGTEFTPYDLVFSQLAREPSSEFLLQHEKLQTYDDYLIQFYQYLHWNRISSPFRGMKIAIFRWM